jgi:opacity protein-like surface antigen
MREWDGTYGGAGLGTSKASICEQVLLTTEAATVANACPGRSALVNVRLGANVQYGHLFWGLESSLDFARSGAADVSLASFNNPSSPSGSYTFAGHLQPTAVAALSTKVGLAGREWNAYLRAGPAAALGARNGRVSYVPAGSTKPSASFEATDAYERFGWLAGAGLELGLYGSWSIGVEYTRWVFGGSKSAAPCTGTGGGCNLFPQATLESSSAGFKTGALLIGLSYYFDY